MTGARVIETLFAAALAASDPRVAVRGTLALDGADVLVAGERFVAPRRIVVVGAGKAAVTMARGAEDVLGARIDTGWVITKDGHARSELPLRVVVAEAAHPIPDARGVAATRRLIDIVAGCRADDLVVALISGGGSALLEAPRPPVTLADLAAMTDLLLKAGAPIHDLNAVRIPLSLVKGGGLLLAAGAAAIGTLILSDVLGSDPRIIASGPTVPGSATRAEALAVIARYGLAEQAPAAIIAALNEPEPMRAEAAGGPLRIIADNALAVTAAQRAAEQAGLRTDVVWTARIGEAREQAVAWVDACATAASNVDLLLGGGELTVTVTGDGVGGRNTEFALAAALELERRGLGGWTIASLATDGEDGPTGVAGAIVDATSAASARATGFDPAAALAANDSLAAVRAGGVVLAPGPTGTNVNDLYFAVRGA